MEIVGHKTNRTQALGSISNVALSVRDHIAAVVLEVSLCLPFY